MFCWFPDSLFLGYPASQRSEAQLGIAMVVSLIMLLVITIMGFGIAYVAMVQSDMVAAVINKPVSMEAAETCIDQAIEWLDKTAGQIWVNGPGYKCDLVTNKYIYTVDDLKLEPALKDMLCDSTYKNKGPLADKNLLQDTLPIGQAIDNRLSDMINKTTTAGFRSCIVEKLSSSTNDITGNEIGTSNGYGSSSFVYLIKITGQGEFKVPVVNDMFDVRFWQPGSSSSLIEAVVKYTP